MAAFEAWDAARASEIVGRFAGMDGSALPILHALQAAFGCIPDAAVLLLADALNQTRAEIHGIVSFYHDFRRTPPGRHLLRLCRAEACQSMGGDAIADTVRRRLGVGWHETSADGAVTLEPVFCLGLCAVAPAALLDDTPLGRLDAERVLAALA